HEASVHSPEELKLIATAARQMGVLPPFQERLIHRALEMDEVPVREIMTPRQTIVSLPGDTLIEAARAPDHIIGVIYSKDLSRLIHSRRTASTRSGACPIADLRISQLMRDVLMV